MVDKKRTMCAAFAAGAGLLLGACGSPTNLQAANTVDTGSASSSSQPVTSTTASPSGTDNAQASDPGHCTADVLKGQLVNLPDGSDTNPQAVAELEITNTGKSRCTMSGWVGLQMIDTHNGPIHTQVQHRSGDKATKITAQPAQVVVVGLEWPAQGRIEGANRVNIDCLPPAAAVQVTAPDDDRPFTIDVSSGTLQVCSPNGTGQITVGTVSTGEAP